MPRDEEEVYEGVVIINPDESLLRSDDMTTKSRSSNPRRKKAKKRSKKKAKKRVKKATKRGRKKAKKKATKRKVKKKAAKRKAKKRVKKAAKKRSKKKSSRRRRNPEEAVETVEAETAATPRDSNPKGKRKKTRKKASKKRGTKKGQRRKTARRAYQRNPNHHFLVEGTDGATIGGSETLPGARSIQASHPGSRIVTARSGNPGPVPTTAPASVTELARRLTVG